MVGEARDEMITRVGTPIAIATAIVLIGCTEPEHRSEVVSGNADTVIIKAGRYSDPGPQATQHCAKYEKSADLENIDHASGSSIYVFKCQ